MYAYACCEDFVLLYPVYAVLFARTGLSGAQISSLFVLWSATTILLEVPSGLWADRFSRRRLVVWSPLVVAAGFATWTFAPSYPAFAAGFVLWGAGVAMRSGALEALVYEEMTRLGAADRYTRLVGRAEAVRTTAEMAATGTAALVLAAGGHTAVGVASVVVPVLGAAVGLTFPEHRAGREPSDEGFGALLREGLGEVRRVPAVRRTVLLVAVLSGVTALDEYLPLLAEATGVADATVPLLMLLVVAVTAVGGWLAGRGTRAAPAALAISAALLAGGAFARSPAGFVPIAVAYAAFRWAIAAAEARLQDRLSDRTRATVTSLSGLGAELVGIAAFAGYALASRWAEPWLVFCLAAPVYLGVAAAMRR
ncbi:MFS transporter [Thermomonospora amylolytica]|uniref:MFS transporter n=1 Tax=Thermomonospora amylolytica TaxID=1411117 RepID=UPI002D7763C4|nr:MFS transporter [Thermomonospora amylolytica]